MQSLQDWVNDGQSKSPNRYYCAAQKKRATHFHHSILLKQHLRNIQKELWLPEPSIIRAVPTRWSSMCFKDRWNRSVPWMSMLVNTEFACPSAFQWVIVSNLVKMLITFLKNWGQKNCAACMHLRSSLQRPCYTDQSQRIAERGGGKFLDKCQSRKDCRYIGSQGRRVCCWTAGCCRSEPKGNV